MPISIPKVEVEVEVEIGLALPTDLVSAVTLGHWIDYKAHLYTAGLLEGCNPASNHFALSCTDAVSEKFILDFYSSGQLCGIL
jgi:hypothetical protein